jgi:histone H1/5
MSDAVAATQVVADVKAKTPKKKATSATKAAKKPADHPKYIEMVQQALSNLKERGGSSRQAILKYIIKNFKVGNDESVVNTHVKIALRSGVKNASLKQSKGTGAAGSFRLGEEAKKPKSAVKKPAKAKAAKKPAKAKAAASAGAKSAKKVVKKAAAKPATKAKADKPKPKKATTPKKAAAAKPVAAKKPKAVKKVADKPKKAASPVKKAKPTAAKKPAAPKAAKKPTAAAKKA